MVEPYRSHLNNPGFMNALGTNVARTGEMAIAGTKAGLSVQQAMDDLKHMKEMRPLELGMVRLKTRAMQEELKRFKILNSAEILNTQAKRVLFEERKRALDAEDDLATAQIVQQFDAEAASVLPALIQRGDTAGIAEFYAAQQETLGPDYHRTANSKYSWNNIKGTLREEQQTQLQHDLQMAAGKGQLKRVGIFDEMDEIIRMELNARRQEEDIRPIEDMTNVELLRMTGGKNLNKGMRNFAEEMIKEIKSNPAAAEDFADELKFFEYLKEDFSGLSGSGSKLVRATGRAFDAPTFTWLPWRADEKEAFRKAYTFAENIRELAEKMDSPNEKVAVAARESIRKVLDELRTYSPKSAVEHARRQRKTAAIRKIEDLGRKARGPFTPPTLPNLDEPASAIRMQQPTSEEETMRILRAANPEMSEEELRENAKQAGLIK